MTTATESPTTLFKETFENMRKATESALETQQEMYAKWSKMWPGMALRKSDWTSRSKAFQKDWAATVTDLMKKQAKLMDQQYQAGIESLEEAFRVATLENPEELRESCEAMWRKTVDLMKATSEKQMQQFQEATNKWIELCQTKP